MHYKLKKVSGKCSVLYNSILVNKYICIFFLESSLSLYVCIKLFSFSQMKSNFEYSL